MISEQPKIVNLPHAPVDLVGQYKSAYTGKEYSPIDDPHSTFNNLVGGDNNTEGFTVIPTKEIDMSGRYPVYFPGMNNEETYAQSQGGWEKAVNGVTKMAGVATSTFINGTAGLVYGAMKWGQTGEVSSMWNNSLSNSLNDFNNRWEDKYAHYQTQRQEDSSWWEPVNLFSGNFVWDGIIKNLGFSMGAMAGGFAWGGLFKAIGLTGKLMSTGVEMASKAETAIGEATVLSQAERLSSINSKLQGLWAEAQPMIGRGLMKTDRAIISLFSSVGEGGIESINNAQQFRQTMISNFEAIHGYSPNKEETEEIDQYTENVGNWSLALNVPLLTATQYIQLPKIFSSTFKGEKALLNTARQEGKYVEKMSWLGMNIPEKGFGKFLYKTKNVASLFFNTTEAFEEGAQYAIQTGTQNYFDKKYRGQESSVLDDGLLYGVREALFTDEGTLNIFLGGFSGALQTSGIHSLGKTGKIGERGITGYGGTEGKFRNEAINTLNKSQIKDKLREAYSSVKAAEIIQQEREVAIRQGDVLESKDLEFDYAHNFISSRLKYNAAGYIKQEIDDLKQEATTNFSKLQQEGIAPATDTKEAFLNRLTNLQEHADNAVILNDAVNLKYKGQVDKTTGKPLYTQDVLDKMVYAGAKVMDYNRRIPQVNEPLVANGIDTQEIIDEVLRTGDINIDFVTKAVADIDAIVGVTNEFKIDLKTNLRDLIELSLRKKQFINEYDDIKNSPKKYQEQKIETKSTVDEQGNPIPKETVTVKTKQGEKEITLDEEYYLGNVFDDDGTPRYPKLKIVSKNEDGTFNVIDGNGKSKILTAEHLENYSLGKVSDIDKSENSRFYYRNVITQPETKTFWNRGKTKGGIKEGRLRYDNATDKLFFVYTENGKEIKKQIGLDSFETKEGFEHGAFYFDRPQTVEDKKDIKDRKESGKTKEDQRDRKSERLKIINTIYEELLQQQKVNTESLQEQKNVLTAIKEDFAIIERLKEAGKQKIKGKFLKIVTTSVRSIGKLTKAKAKVDGEITRLTQEQEILQTNLAYIQDFSQGLDELPDNSKEFLQELKDQVGWIEELYNQTGKTISELTNLSMEIQNTIISIVKLLKDSIQKHSNEYPFYIKETIDAIIAGDLSQLPLLKEYLSEYTLLENMEVEISINEEKLADVIGRLEKLNEWYKEIEDEYNAKKLLLDKFQQVVETYRKQKEEENRLKNNKNLIKEALKTRDKTSVHTNNSNEFYEAVRKKAVEFIWRATMGVNRGKPHQERANKFGFNFNKFKNKKDIRGIFITSQNEEQLIPGLTKYLVTSNPGMVDETIDESVDQSDIIAMVMIDIDGELIGVDGQLLTEAQLENPLEYAVYQVMPSAELTWSAAYGGKSMFRKGTPQEEIDAITHQYGQMREKIKTSATDLNNNIHEIGTSFGIPRLVEQIDEHGNVIKDKEDKSLLDYSTRISVTDAGLVKEVDLLSTPLIRIPKTNKIVEEGTTSYISPLGVPFLQLPNAVLPLQNRQHTATEAETIYQTILQLAKNMMNPEIGIKHQDSVRLYEWLKSVVYWGVPETREEERKSTKSNSVFWEVDNAGEFILTISNQGVQFPFTPTQLEENHYTIVEELKSMYNNINSSKADDITEPYEEILSVYPSGDLVVQTWKNYQAYLLSDKFIAEDKDDPNNGKPRKDLPLSTIMTPLADNEDVNRTGIYFYTDDNAGEIEKPTVTKAKTIKPGAPTIPAKEYVLDGKTVNIYTNKIGKKIAFTSTEEGNIIVQSGGDIKDIKSTLRATIKKNEPKLTEEKVDNKIKSIIKEVIGKAIAPFIVKTKIQEEEIEEYTIPDVDEEVKTILDEEEVEEDNEDEFTIPDNDLREITNEQIEQLEDWTKLEKWLKTNFPNVPIYRVKNIIKATNGRQAWGMFKEGAIYVYQNAEIGTAYHEVFEAVWKMFSSLEEQQSIINEFKNRKGGFTDRVSGKTINYIDATPQQIKEQLAEEFRDYVQFKKVPVKPKDGRPFIVKLFSDLVTFIKSVFFGRVAQSEVEKMFQNIDTGFYKDIPYTNQLAFANKGIMDIENVLATDEDEFRLAGISDKKRSEIIQHMTYRIIYDMISTDESLFNIVNKKKTDIYNNLKPLIIKTIAKTAGITKKVIASGKLSPKQLETLKLMNDVSTQWNNIVTRHEEYLKGYAIEFDENDKIQFTDENKIRESDYVDANRIDSFKKANAAIKLLLSTMTVVDANGVWKPSSVGGVILQPISKTYISLMSTLHNSRSVEDMLTKLKEMAQHDPNYRTLYKRITKRSWSDKGVSVDYIETTHGIRLLASFWKTFKKQNPSVKNVYILDNGEIVVGDANLSSAAAQLRDEYLNAIIFKAKSGDSHFAYDKKRKVYIGNATSIKAIELNGVPAMISFLKTLGIEFNATIPSELQRKFKEAVSGIRKSISEGKDIASFSTKVLSIHGRLLELGYVQAAISNPEFDSTFFGINKERTQTFIGTNPASDLYDFLSQLDEFTEKSLAGSQYSYLLTDVFSKGSSILKRMFTNGQRINTDESKELMHVAYIGGIDNQQKGKQKQSAKLNYKERLVQELNLNLAGYYLNLVPGDASMEWALYMGNAISKQSLVRGMTSVNLIFKDYFIDELNLVRERDERQSSMAKLGEDKKTGKPIYRNAKEMRFFKSILGDSLHNDIILSEGTTEEVYTKFENRINSTLNSFIKEQNTKLKTNLKNYNILHEGEDGWSFENINIKENLTENELDSELSFLNINYIINNIELHKLIYSDPYQYADELKRIKNFNSPRQALINNSPKMNVALHKIWNKGFDKGDIGWTNFTQDFFRSVTLKEVLSVVKDMTGYTNPFKEADGGGVITFTAYRNFRVRIGEWNDDEERQYVHDMDYETYAKNGATEEELEEFNRDNPKIRSAYTPIKPIVSGNKANENSYNDVLLDKFALYPLSYRLMMDVNKAGGKTTSNAIALYNKMQTEKIDYAVFESSRKVGAIDAQSIYNENGEFNNTPYSKESIINVPFAIMSVQTDVPSKDDGDVTRGSQATKLVTMDFMEAGVPIDAFPGMKFDIRYKSWYRLSEEEKKEKSSIYKEIKHNQELLENMMEQGYQDLLTQLGIKEEKGKYTILDLSKAGITLRNEILKREVNDNISDALTAFINGKSVLEATPAYQQIRNILYSIADREIIHPKINGGLRVLIPSTLLESIRPVQVSKGVYTSDVLDFYSMSKDGKTVNVSEIMVARWFDSDKSDAELLEYLNETEEGQKILSGFAFRIPTQKQNSIEVFKIKQFLPREFGDSVILPAAMVAKSGADFDIDKLSIYLKNTYEDALKNIKLIPFYGYGQQAKDKFKELYNSVIEEKVDAAEDKLLKQSQLQSLFGDIALGIGSDKLIKKWTGLFKEWFANELIDGKLPVHVIEEIFISRIEKLNKKIDKLTNVDVQEIMAEETAERWYKKSLQNEFIQSSQNLASHPSNYARLTTPNSAKQLSDLATKIAEKTIGQSFNYTEVGNILDRVFMSRLRHAFLSAKQNIAIAATNQTNHSLMQRFAGYIDPERLKNVSPEDKIWLGNAKISFNKYNKIFINGKEVATFSMIKNADGQDISDIISQIIDGSVDATGKLGPWLIELGATPNVISTWLFLVKIGVPIDTIAYFMNQPIIKDYLRSIENAGYSYLFMDSFVKNMKETYSSTGKVNTLPNKTILESLVGMPITKLNNEQKEQQQFILDEFLKYAKMAEQMFYVTQGSNFDTANFNDPYLVFKKFEQLKKAQNTIISDVDELLNNSFIGRLGETIKKMRDSLSSILASDQNRVRKIIEKVLLPFVDMNDQDFIKLSQKAVSDLFDYAVQTDREFNKDIQNILIKNGGVGKQVVDFMKTINSSHPLYENYIVGHDGIMKSIASNKAEDTGVNNIRVKGLGNKAYDQNNIIYAFRELREYMKEKNNPLYDRIVQLAVLQSGLSTSNISFTSVLPYEDFDKLYNQTLSKLSSISGLEKFNTLNVFQRNNWNNDDIVPWEKAKLILREGKRPLYNMPMSFYNNSKVLRAIKEGKIPQVMTVRQHERAANSTHIVYTWEKYTDLITPEYRAKYPRVSDNTLVKKIKAEMRNRGDFSYINKGLFEKVVDNYGNPLETFYINNKGERVDQFVYKAINAWGDGHRANEFYENEHMSVIDNGFIKVNGVDNNTIIDIFDKKTNASQEMKESLNQNEKIDISKSLIKSTYFEKDRLKFANANKLISRGSEKSSSNAYKNAVGNKANVGMYNSNDIIAISSEGNRTGRIAPDFAEIQKAIDANVTFITDNSANRNRDYNIGEREVAKYLSSKGYIETNDGIWQNTKEQTEDWKNIENTSENPFKC